MKTSIITECQFSGDWKAPNGDMLYYHNITLKNGDTGSVATAEKYASKIEVGKEVTYTINGSKIKLQQPEGANSTPQTYNGANANKQRKQYNYARGKQAPDFLGYACSYAKDMVIAGKAKAADIKAYKNAAEQIYKHIQELLKNEQSEGE